MTKKCLLISNSTLHGSGYLDHCAKEIKHFLGTKKTIVFIPYARPSGITYDDYTKIAQQRFKKIGIGLKGIHTYTTPQNAINNAEALFIGGGNTFVLLTKMYETNILSAIRNKVSEGMPYIGTSAGSNVACKTIKTTNDMPIMYPPSYEALQLVPFNINPHYQDPDPQSTHKGETRETRIHEFHIYNTEYVVGLREGAMLHIQNDTVTLKGSTGARIFKNDTPPQEYLPGESLDFLMKTNKTPS